MHLKRFLFQSKAARRRYPNRRSFLINGLEKTLLRAMILCAVLLAVFQLKSVTDPVDFYLKVAGDIDTPAFKYEQYVDDQQITSGRNSRTISLYFQAEPESSVMVKQNEKTLGIIGKGVTLEVQAGTVYLDATHLVYPVSVQIILNEKSHQLELNSDMKSFDIQFKANSSS